MTHWKPDTKSYLSFISVEEKHRSLVRSWLDKEHVKEWFYGEGLEKTLSNLELFIKGVKNNGVYSFELWIAYIGEQPFGFIMTSLVEGPFDPEDPINKWFQERKETITLDVLIGSEKYLGQGLAHQMIQEFIRDRCSYADRVLIDPSVLNTRAIHVYEKVGFKKIEQFVQGHDEPGMCWMMHLDVNQK